MALLRFAPRAIRRRAEQLVIRASSAIRARSKAVSARLTHQEIPQSAQLFLAESRSMHRSLIFLFSSKMKRKNAWKLKSMSELEALLLE